MIVAACTLPLLALFHQVAMASAALALDWLFGPRGIAASLVTDHGDAIYSRLVLRMVNSARPTALAIATPLR
ncbi:MAG TPA: hypothetical protein VIR57_05820, partial [Chloroflexota bacterium]